MGRDTDKLFESPDEIPDGQVCDLPAAGDENARRQRIGLQPGRKWCKILGRTIALLLVHGPEHDGAPRSVGRAPFRNDRLDAQHLLRRAIRMIVISRNANRARV